MVVSMLDLDLQLRNALGISLLSHDIRLVLHLVVCKSLIIKEASLLSLLSERAFYELAKRMGGDGTIVFARSAGDKRSKSIVMGDGARAALFRKLDEHLKKVSDLLDREQTG